MMNKTKKEYVATFVCQKLAVSVRTDAEEIVDCVCERLQHHFNAKEYSDSILVTAFSVQHRKKEVFQLLTNRKYWEEKRHMKQIFFYSNEVSRSPITIWRTNSCKDKTECTVAEIVNKFLLGEQGICLVEMQSCSHYNLYYNDVDDYVGLSVMRIVRSLFMNRMVGSGYMYVHAAAVRYQGKGVLICGDSGKGKTSTILDFLENCEGELVANDKVYIGQEDGTLYVQGWPTVVTLGVGSMKKHQRLNKYLTTIDDITCQQDLYHYTPKRDYLSMSNEELQNLDKEGNKLVVSHQKIASLFGKTILGHMGLDLIISVDHGWDKQEILTACTSEQEKKDIIIHNRISNISDQLGWLGKDRVVDIYNEERLLNIMGKDIPLYKYSSAFEGICIGKVLNEVLDGNI